MRVCVRVCVRVFGYLLHAAFAPCLVQTARKMQCTAVTRLQAHDERFDFFSQMVRLPLDVLSPPPLLPISLSTHPQTVLLFPEKTAYPSLVLLVCCDVVVVGGGKWCVAMPCLAVP